jgi:spore coat polysaccharide biosynthesis protein SpsF
MRTVAIIQARTTSTRLPGKVLMELAGATMLAQQLRRLRRCETLDEIVVATTANAADDPVVRIAEQEGARWFRGSERDVLGRYVGAARAARAEAVVRVTADCPLLDPGVVDLVAASLTPGWDYASNTLERTFPAGLDAEALHLDTLLRADRLGISPEAREHVTWLVAAERPELFLLRSVLDEQDNSDLRWTVDVEGDLELVRRLYDELDLGRSPLPYREVIAYVRARPALVTANAGGGR